MDQLKKINCYYSSLCRGQFLPGWLAIYLHLFEQKFDLGQFLPHFSKSLFQNILQRANELIIDEPTLLHHDTTCRSSRLHLWNAPSIPIHGLHLINAIMKSLFICD